MIHLLTTTNVNIVTARASAGGLEMNAINQALTPNANRLKHFENIFLMLNYSIENY